MNNYSKSTEPPDLDLELPDAPDFISRPPAFSVAEMIQLCEKMLPYWNQQRYATGSHYLEPVKMEPLIIDE